MQQIVYLTDLDGIKAAGLPFKTVDQARWAHRKRAENGLGGAFVMIAGRVAIDVQRFYELARQRAA